MLFFYKILFAAEILVAEFLFTFRLKKRRQFPLRFAAVSAVTIAVAAAFPVGFSAANTFWYNSLTFLTIFAITLPGLRLCYDESMIGLFFCCMAAYTTQHFAYELVNLLFALVLQARSPLLGMYTEETVTIGFNRMTLLFVIGYLMCYVAAYTAMYFFFARRIRAARTIVVRSKSMMFLIAAGLLADIILNSVLAYHGNMDFVGEAISYVTNMLCCALLIYAQFGLLQTTEAEAELALVDRLRRQEREQYEFSRENIDLINMKCHDMRHQLREIGRSRSMPEDVVREMESAISLYDAVVKTGNVALDTVLTEKSLQCAKAGIRLTCVADGGALSFMGESDIYSLFGNALENATDAVMRLGEADRVISLKVYRTGELVTITVRNPYAGKVTFDERGLPETTKGGADTHGYGVRSIMQTAEKYGGRAAVTADGGVFALNVLLPVPIGEADGVNGDKRAE